MRLNAETNRSQWVWLSLKTDTQILRLQLSEHWSFMGRVQNSAEVQNQFKRTQLKMSSCKGVLSSVCIFQEKLL